MKNWADHCSSDEESIDGIDDVAEQVQVQTLEEEAAPAPVVEGEAAPAAPRTYEFPSSPPFTAFIGNLAYSVKEPEELKEAVIKCASEHLGKELVILGARISFDRNGKHRGFGYLELDTLEELKLLMKLNESQGTIAGRKIQLDTASGKQSSRKNQRRSNNGGGDGMIDGSKFRGGKFGNRGGRQDNNKDDGPPLQRPSLKLAPRTKKAEDGDASGPSNIFGGARARDAQAWEERRKSDNSSDRRQSQSSNSNSGRGGRGSRGGRGGHNNNSSSKGENGKDRRKTKEQKKQISPEERAAMAKAAAEAAAPAPAPKPAAPVNKFALLMDDSDSD